MAAIDIDSIRTGAAGANLVIETVEQTQSTNGLLMEAPFGRAPGPPRLLAAARQTAGRGRRGRSWLMEPGRSAAFSVAIERWADSTAPALGLPLAVGVAVVGALAPHAPDLRLKWPNDLQRRGRKLGGILVESRRGSLGAAQLERFVIGIGLNLLAPRDSGQRIGQPVAGLFEQQPLPVPVGFLIGQIAAAVVADIGLFLREGLGPFRAAWHRVDALHGERVAILVDGRVETAGIARGIDSDGALLLETAQGLRVIHSGEVSVRPVAASRADGDSAKPLR